MATQLAVKPSAEISISNYPEAQRLQIMAIQARHPKVKIKGEMQSIPIEAAIALYQEEQSTGLSVANREIGWSLEFGIYVSSKTKSFAALQYAKLHGEELIPKYTLIHPTADKARFEDIAKRYKPVLTSNDTVVECHIVSPKRRREYWQLRFNVTSAFAAEGLKGDDLRAAVIAAIGNDATETVGIGVVRANEIFGDIEGGKTITRTQRAEKRALHNAVNIGGLAAPVSTIDRPIKRIEIQAPQPNGEGDIDYSGPEPVRTESHIDGEVVEQPEAPAQIEAPAAITPTQLPAPVATIIAPIQHKADFYREKGWALSDKQSNLLNIFFGSKLVGKNEGNIKTLKIALLGCEHLADVDPALKKALWTEFLKPEADPKTGYLVPCETAQRQSCEIVRLMQAA